jgi:4-amino-4-deoxy-L-arabinose transferase-like glycosyltransferase
MTISDRIQSLILTIESGKGNRLLWSLATTLALAGLIVWYDVWAYHGFSAPDAMDAAQVARNLSEGHGFTTLSISPFGLYLTERKGSPAGLSPTLPAQPGGYYPDEVNPPFYPIVLAGLFKLTHPNWELDLKKSFWSVNGHFQRYKPEFFIAICNQILLMIAVVLTFLLARKWFDPQAAWLAALVTLGSNELWQFSVSGLSTVLLLVILLALTLCLTHFEALARTEPANRRSLVSFALAAGALTGLGLLTRYAFGWMIIPTCLFLWFFGGPQRKQMTGLAGALFALIVTPWLVRNYLSSGEFFGRAGYAVLEGTSLFPGMTLLQTSSPEMAGAVAHGGWISLILHKLAHNSVAIFQNDLPRLGGWAAVLFFAGLLLGYRNPAPRRLRYFTLMCLGIFVLVQALGRTWLSDLTPDVNSENLLVLLTPLLIIFGIAFFLTLLDQMNLPNRETRFAALILLVGLLCLPFITGFLPPKPRPVAYPPYYPPEIQHVSSWLEPDELMMSDAPWAVAWYGRHSCITLARDSQDDFSAVNNYLQPVKGVYLTSLTLDDKFFSNVLRSQHDGWSHLVLNFIIKDAVDQAAGTDDNDALSRIRIVPATPTDYLNGFPLRTARSLDAGLFFTDHPRWRESH